MSVYAGRQAMLPDTYKAALRQAHTLMMPYPRKVSCTLHPLLNPSPSRAPLQLRFPHFELGRNPLFPDPVD